MLTDQNDDNVFITHQSSVTSVSTGEDEGRTASRSEPGLIMEDRTLDQQDG